MTRSLTFRPRDVERYIDERELPKTLECAITTRLPTDPVWTSSKGSIFERSALQHWVDKYSATDPMNRNKLSLSDVQSSAKATATVDAFRRAVILSYRLRAATAPTPDSAAIFAREAASHVIQRAALRWQAALRKGPQGIPDGDAPLKAAEPFDFQTLQMSPPSEAPASTNWGQMYQVISQAENHRHECAKTSPECLSLSELQARCEQGRRILNRLREVFIFAASHRNHLIETARAQGRPRSIPGVVGSVVAGSMARHHELAPLHEQDVAWELQRRTRGVEREFTSDFWI